jgi:hypothetical protein
MWALAIYRRVNDDEYQSLLERAREGGVAQAVYELANMYFPSTIQPH